MAESTALEGPTAFPIRRETILAIVGRRSMSALTMGLAALVGLAAIAWLALATSHFGDRFALDHVAGTRMALAQYANRGELYPPLFAHGFFGGSRFMPIPILLHAGLARATGEYLTSGKVVSYVSMGFLLVMVFVILRDLAVPVVLALALSSAILVTQPGLLAATGISGDALPIALQLLALRFVAKSSRGWSLLAAAGLCALAIFSKQSAVWAPVAAVLWLLRSDRRRAGLFTAGFFASFAVLFGAVAIFTHGRLLANVGGLSFSGESGLSSILRPFSLPRLLLDRTGAAALLVVLAIAGGLWSFARRDVSLYGLGFASALVVLAIVLTDVGADYNHLLDVVVLGMILVGELWSRVSSRRIGGSLAQAALALVVLATTATSFFTTMAGPAAASITSMAHRTADPSYDPDPLHGYEQSGTSILSEDPYISVRMGQPPVVLDAFMVRRMQASHPSWIRDLIGRIDTRAFDEVVLLKPLDSSVDWYTTWDFGKDVWAALRRNYRLTARPNGYFLYAPIR